MGRRLPPGLAHACLAPRCTLAVTRTPEAAAGPVVLTGFFAFTGEARCIAIDETATGFRASIAGELTDGDAFEQGLRGFRLTVYDNTQSGQPRSAT
jgi:hypothetical protein